MEPLRTSRLLKIVAGPAMLFTLSSLALALVIYHFYSETAFSRWVWVTTAFADAVSTWWLLRLLRAQHSAPDARRGAAAFAFSAPLVLRVAAHVGIVLGLDNHGFAENVFLIPAEIVFAALLTAIVPGAVVKWAVYPSGAVKPVNQGSR